MKNYNERTLKNVIEDYVDEWDEDLLREQEDAQNNPAFQNEDGEADAFAEEHKTVKKKKHKFLFLKVASVLLFFVLCATVIPIPVEGRKSTLAEIIVNYVNSDFIAVDSNEDDRLLLSYEGEFVPSYIPEGYYVDSVNNNKDITEIVFTNKNNNVLVFREQVLDVKSNIDYEDVANKQEVEILGYKGIAFEKDGNNRIVVTTEDKIIYCYCDDDEVDLIGFAKLIERR